MSKLILQAEQLHKTYRLGRVDLNVLRGVSLKVPAGEKLAVIGASGAGKSTLLHMLGGLDVPDQGQVLFDGIDLYKLRASKRTNVRALRVGFVFQFYHLLPELNLLENVMLPAMSQPGFLSRQKEAAARAGDLLARVGLGDRREHRPAELSGGEQQRAALARALMNEPEVIMADEPTGNLDSHTGDQVLQYLFDLISEKGHTLILVTHNESVASRCDRCLTLTDGLLEGSDKAMENGI